VITLSVTDVDKAAAFYAQQVGFALDVDYHPAGDFRVVQLTPPGSACSVQVGVGLTDVPPWRSNRSLTSPPTARPSFSSTTATALDQEQRQRRLQPVLSSRNAGSGSWR
jgi:hypothetical protein